jgi:hypothetical protein
MADSRLVLASDDVYRKIIIPMTGISMVPVVLVSSGSSSQTYAIQDSKDIMQFFEDKFPSPATPLLPATPKRRFIAMLLELLADEWFVVQAMYWRWSPQNLEKQKTFLEYEFGRSASGDSGTFAEIVAIGAKVRLLGSRFLLNADGPAENSEIRGILPWTWYYP